MAGATALAGRVGELRAVSALLAGESAAAGMLVLGEAGVGKSRLVAAAAAARDDVVVLPGWCLPLSQGLPLLPVADVLRECARVDEGRLLVAALAACPAFVRAEVARQLPEVADPTEHATAIELDEGWRRQRLFDALQRLLAAVARLRPATLLIEDVQWADSSTLDFLEYLSAPGHITGVSVLFTCRSEEAPTQELVDWFERLQRNPLIDRLELAPLTVAETADQIEQLMGSRPSRTLVDGIYARSEGNAFFTEQLVAAQIGGKVVGLPSGLKSLLLSRIGQVTGTSREVLDGLAVATQPMNEASLARLCARTESEVQDAVRDLRSRRLVRRSAQGDEYELRHALLAEAASDSLLASQRRELHARIADMIADGAGSAAAAQIAEHFTAADRPALELRWRVLAARHADGLGAAREASVQWRRAIVLWREDRGRAVAVSEFDPPQLYLRAAAATEIAGDGVTAAALTEEAVSRFADNCDAATKVSLYRAAGHYRSIESPKAGLAALSIAIQAGDGVAPTRDYVRAMRAYVNILQNEGWLDEQDAMLAKGLGAARKMRNRAEEMLLLVDWAWAKMSEGLAKEAVDAVEAARTLVPLPRDPVLEVKAGVGETEVLLKLGELDRVIEIGMPLIREAADRDYADSYRMHMLCGNVCEALVELGQVDPASTLIDPFTQDSPNRDSRFLYAVRADLDTRRGRFEPARAYWAANREDHASVANAEMRTELMMLQAQSALWLADQVSVLTDAMPVLVHIGQTDRVRFGAQLFVLALQACADQAETARAIGDDAQLRSMLQHAERLTELRQSAKADPFAARPAPVACFAFGLTWAAEWSRLHGPTDPGAWERAALAWDALTRPHRAAYARWRQAEALFAQPRGRVHAAEVLRTAAAQAVQHIPLAQEIHKLARRARVDLNAADGAAQQDRPAIRAFGLTDRELAVLRLVGTGRTNAQIGTELFISSKTAGVHVTNILRKLGVSTRVQAAAVAERAGLLHGD
jgi:DNA-binding CsgD family transcriptional regulator